MKAYEVRFSGVVYPGEELTTERWQFAYARIVIRMKIIDDRIMVSNAEVELG